MELISTIFSQCSLSLDCQSAMNCRLVTADLLIHYIMALLPKSRGCKELKEVENPDTDRGCRAAAVTDIY